MRQATNAVGLFATISNSLGGRELAEQPFPAILSHQNHMKHTLVKHEQAVVCQDQCNEYIYEIKTHHPSDIKSLVLDTLSTDLKLIVPLLEEYVVRSASMTVDSTV